VTQIKSWDDAQLYCQTHYRAKLVTIANMADQLRLQAYLETINGQPELCLASFCIQHLSVQLNSQFLPRDAL